MPVVNCYGIEREERGEAFVSIVQGDEGDGMSAANENPTPVEKPPSGIRTSKRNCLGTHSVPSACAPHLAIRHSTTHLPVWQ